MTGVQTCALPILEIRIDGGPVPLRGDDIDDGTIEKFGARLDAIAGHLGISV